MKISKRLMACILSFTLVISNVIPSMAGLDDNTNAGGSEVVGNDPVYAHKFMAYPENQGYRISIVDKNGNRVANSIDMVNYVPADVTSVRIV